MKLTRRTSESLRTKHDELEPNPVDRLMFLAEQMQTLSKEVLETADAVREEMRSGTSTRKPTK